MQDFEKSLQALIPTGQNRDQMLFLMGKASTKNYLRWVWPSLAVLFGLTSLGLGVALFAGSSSSPSIIYVERPTLVPAPVPQPPIEKDIAPPHEYPSPIVKVDPKITDPKTKRVNQIQREVLIFGVNALPENKDYDENERTLTNSAREEFSEWLGVTPKELGFPKR